MPSEAEGDGSSARRTSRAPQHRAPCRRQTNRDGQGSEVPTLPPEIVPEGFQEEATPGSWRRAGQAEGRWRAPGSQRSRGPEAGPECGGGQVTRSPQCRVGSAVSAGLWDTPEASRQRVPSQMSLLSLWLRGQGAPGGGACTQSRALRASGEAQGQRPGLEDDGGAQGCHQ